jgi:hypothetical protein
MMLKTFVDVLNSDVGKAAVAEFMLPGAGPLLLKNSKEEGGDGKDVKPAGKDQPAKDNPAAGKT